MMIIHRTQLYRQWRAIGNLEERTATAWLCGRHWGLVDTCSCPRPCGQHPTACALRAARLRGQVELASRQHGRRRAAQGLVGGTGASLKRAIRPVARRAPRASEQAELAPPALTRSPPRGGSPLRPGDGYRGAWRRGLSHGIGTLRAARLRGFRS